MPYCLSCDDSAWLKIMDQFVDEQSPRPPRSRFIEAAVTDYIKARKTAQQKGKR